MFPGANATREDAAYAVVGAPLDASTTFRPGTRFGPRQLAHVAESFSDYDHHTGLRFTDLDVHDHGEIYPGDDAAEYLEFLRGTLADYREEGTVPLTVGGEHTVTVAGLRAVEPDVYVCLDAHLDLREQYRGNPLNHATVAHHALETVSRVVVLGARSGSETGWERAQRDDRITVVPPEEVREWVPDFSGEEVYLSVDIDAADPGFAPGTGTPEPFGLDPRTMHRLVRAVAPHCSGFDVVEVNDNDDGQAAVLGAKLLRAFVFAREAARRTATDDGGARTHEGRVDGPNRELFVVETGSQGRASELSDTTDGSTGAAESDDGDDTLEEVDGIIDGDAGVPLEDEPTLGEDELPEDDPLGEEELPDDDPLGEEELPDDDPLGEDELPEDDPLGEEELPEDDPLETDAAEPWPDWSAPDEDDEDADETLIVAESDVEWVDDSPPEPDADGAAGAGQADETSAAPQPADAETGPPDTAKTDETAHRTQESADESVSSADRKSESGSGRENRRVKSQSAGEPSRRERSSPSERRADGEPADGVSDDSKSDDKSADRSADGVPDDEPVQSESARRESAGETAQGDVSVTKREYDRVTRMLQNREFPVDRAEFEMVAANAYGLQRAQCAKVLDVAIDQGLLDERDGQLHPPEG